MPSNTAFLNDMPDTELIASHTAFGNTADRLARTPLSNPKITAVSPRMFYGIVNNLRALGIDVDENNRVLRGLRLGIITNYSLYMLYGAYRAYIKAQTMKETALAATETAAMAVAQQWGLIAQAGAAAALVAGTFAVGEKFGSGDWTFPSFDMSNPLERRQAIRQLEEVR